MEGDGLHIFSSNCPSALYAKSISIYPSTHPDFLSTHTNSLNFNLADICENDLQSEFIPRKDNRIVLINSQLPFYINTYGLRNIGDNFEEVTSYVFIVHLSV